MDKKQRRNLWILAGIGAVYFLLLLVPNAYMRGSDNPLVYLHTDEYVVYPSLERMFDFGPTLSTAWGRIIIHGEYHYGYPFFFISWLALLPLRLIEGQAFFENVQRNIFLLRQLTCVLPMIATAGVMTYVTTELRKTWQAVVTFVFILTIPAVVGNVTQWWHPDALMMLMVALTFLFLKLDKQRLGSYFYLAAAACGMATSIKLTGFFFFLAIPLYIVMVWHARKLPWKKALGAAVGFVVVMAVVIVVTNPFLFYEGPRNDMLAIQAYKTQELRYGYDHEESIYYRLGPQYWQWTVETSYGSVDFPLALLGALALSALAQPKDTNKWVLLAWILPMGIYLMWFVSPKPDHYLLPVMLPLYATVTGAFDLAGRIAKAPQNWARWTAYAVGALWVFLVVTQFVWQINTVYARYLDYLLVG
jgi:4-amino-4-deoxy-L-arabinose transferase-like glycosyltransferase